jgi:hypothetical protein
MLAPKDKVFWVTTDTADPVGTRQTSRKKDSSIFGRACLLQEKVVPADQEMCAASEATRLSHEVPLPRLETR